MNLFRHERNLFIDINLKSAKPYVDKLLRYEKQFRLQKIRQVCITYDFIS